MHAEMAASDPLIAEVVHSPTTASDSTAKWTLCISGLGGHLCNLDAAPDWTLYELKKAVEEATGITIWEQEAFVAGTSEVRGNVEQLRSLLVLEEPKEDISWTLTLIQKDGVERQNEIKSVLGRFATLDLECAEELEFALDIIFSKVEAEPCIVPIYAGGIVVFSESAACADLVSALRTRYPECPPVCVGQRTFTSVLLRACIDKLESLLNTLEASGDETVKCRRHLDIWTLRSRIQCKRVKVLRHMHFLGNLFCRKLLTENVIERLVHDMIGIERGLPEEHRILCVCVLLETVGLALDCTSDGKRMMSLFCDRLIDLKCSMLNGKPALSQKIQFKIQSLMLDRACLPLDIVRLFRTPFAPGTTMRDACGGEYTTLRIEESGLQAVRLSLSHICCADLLLVGDWYQEGDQSKIRVWGNERKHGAPETGDYNIEIFQSRALPRGFCRYQRNQARQWGQPPAIKVSFCTEDKRYKNCRTYFLRGGAEPTDWWIVNDEETDIVRAPVKFMLTNEPADVRN